MNLSRWIILFVLVILTSLNLKSVADASVQHFVVYQDDQEFAGWPANEGMWQWGDEILVAFEVSNYIESGGHNIDRNSPKRIVFARSLDGGLSWKHESHPEILPPVFLEDFNLYHDGNDFEALKFRTQSIDFKNPDLAIKIRGSRFYISIDRGHHWEGPYAVPDFGMPYIAARSNYLCISPSVCRFFYCASSRERTENYARVMMVETQDGGKTFEKISWLTADPFLFDSEPGLLPSYSIMPSVLSFPDGEILASIRCRSGSKKWNLIVSSIDEGRTWNTLGNAFENNNNPSSLVFLAGDRVAILYAKRKKDENGIYAKVSVDRGRSWSSEYILRKDARDWDIGYVRAAKRMDGKVLVVYYYSTNDLPVNHIAATIWDVENDFGH